MAFTIFYMHLYSVFVYITHSKIYSFTDSKSHTVNAEQYNSEFEKLYMRQ